MVSCCGTSGLIIYVPVAIYLMQHICLYFHKNNTFLKETKKRFCFLCFSTVHKYSGCFPQYVIEKNNCRNKSRPEVQCHICQLQIHIRLTQDRFITHLGELQKTVCFLFSQYLCVLRFLLFYKGQKQNLNTLSMEVKLMNNISTHRPYKHSSVSKSKMNLRLRRL